MGRRLIITTMMVPVGKAAENHVRMYPPRYYPCEVGRSPSGVEYVARSPDQYIPMRDRLLDLWMTAEAERQIKVGLADQGVGAYMEEDEWSNSLVRRYETADLRKTSLRLLGGTEEQLRHLEHRMVCSSPYDRTVRNARKRVGDYRAGLHLETPGGYRLRRYEVNIRDTGMINIKWEVNRVFKHSDFSFFDSYCVVTREARGKIRYHMNRHTNDVSPAEEVMNASREIFEKLDELGLAIVVEHNRKLKKK